MAKIAAIYQTGNPLLPTIALSQDGKIFAVSVEINASNDFRIHLKELEQVEAMLPESLTTPEAPEA